MQFAAWICFALLTLCAGASRAAGSHPTARLELTRAETASSCLDASRLAKSVQARLRRQVFVEVGATLRLEVSIERGPIAWLARLTLSDSLGVLGTRELSSESRHCSALDESLALVVALLVDTPPERAAPEPPATTESAGAATQRPLIAPAAPQPTPLSIPADAFAPREPWSFDARLSATVSAGLVPNLGMGLEAGVGLRAPRGPWLRLLAELSFPREARIDEARGARFALRRAGLDVCGFELRAGPARVSGCLGQRVGLITVEGLGFQQNTASRRLAFALSGGLEGAIPIGRYFALSCGIRAELPFARDRFTGQTATGGETLIFRSAPVAAAARAGVRVEW